MKTLPPSETPHAPIDPIKADWIQKGAHMCVYQPYMPEFNQFTKWCLNKAWLIEIGVNCFAYSLQQPLEY